MTFQEQLITLRKQQGLSQEQLGAKLGVTRQTVSKWELGITTPEMDKLMLLADLFHISIDELVGRKRKNGESETEHGHTAEAVPPVKEIHYIPYPWHYEYKSRRTLFGLPLVHINIGRWIPGRSTAGQRVSSRSETSRPAFWPLAGSHRASFLWEESPPGSSLWRTGCGAFACGRRILRGDCRSWRTGSRDLRNGRRCLWYLRPRRSGSRPENCGRRICPGRCRHRRRCSGRDRV